MRGRPALPRRALFRLRAALLALTIAAAAPAGAQPAPPRPGCVIKGNIASSGERIYHVPGGAFYNATEIDPRRGERWFCSEAEAVAAGWRRSKR